MRRSGTIVCLVIFILVCTSICFAGSLEEKAEQLEKRIENLEGMLIDQDKCIKKQDKVIKQYETKFEHIDTHLLHKEEKPYQISEDFKIGY